MKLRYLFRALKAGYRDQKLEIALARTIIRGGDFVADVGANKGAYLFWLRKAVGSDGTVLAFEPQRRLAAYLESVCVLLRWQNVKILPLALSDKSGNHSLHVPNGGISPGASLESSVLRETGGDTIECQIVRLDDQLGHAPRLTFLKIDVEGHELSVFKGGFETIKRDQPAILFECEARHLTNHSMNDVFEYLKALNYQGFFLTKHALMSLVKFDVSIHQKHRSQRFWDEPDYFNNFLFIPNTFDVKTLSLFNCTNQ